MDANGPLQAKMHFGFPNAEIRSGIRSLWPKRSKWPLFGDKKSPVPVLKGKNVGKIFGPVHLPAVPLGQSLEEAEISSSPSTLRPPPSVNTTTAARFITRVLKTGVNGFLETSWFLEVLSCFCQKNIGNQLALCTVVFRTLWVPKEKLYTPPSFHFWPKCIFQGRGVSGGNKRDKLKGTNARDSQFSADFRRFSLFLGIPAFQRRRFSQKTAGNRRFSQEIADFCRNPFVPCSLSLLVPP